jgi:formylglycine-generating enzyme required for sulfatase activity
VNGEEKRRRYAWGNDFDAHKCNVDETGLGRTCAVGCFPDGVSPDGVLDMAGNVWDWCADWYDKNYYQQSRDITEKGEGYKVLRGGSFNNAARHARCAYRMKNLPDNDFHFLGFRVARIPNS